MRSKDSETWERMSMKFTNLKSCDGTIESYLHLRGGLVRLSDLPAHLKKLSQHERIEVLEWLSENKLTEQYLETERDEAELATA